MSVVGEALAFFVVLRVHADDSERCEPAVVDLVEVGRQSTDVEVCQSSKHFQYCHHLGIGDRSVLEPLLLFLPLLPVQIPHTQLSQTTRVLHLFQETEDVLPIELSALEAQLA